MKHYFITAMCICLIALAGCNKASADNYTENAKARAELAARYPDAVNVNWVSKNGYSIAKFNRLATRAHMSEYDFSVWFTRSGDWCMTESEVTYDALPLAVRTAFETSEYAGWKIDDIDKIERIGMETFYVIEVETKASNIEKEAELYYSADGVIIKVTSGFDSDYDYEDYLPSDIQSAIESFINARYPGAVIVDSEYDDGEIEVEIIHNGRGKDVYFSRNNEWLRTKYDIRKSEIPDVVMAQVNVKYASWKIDDAEYMETPSGEWFVIELEKGESEVKIRITADGVIL